MPDYRLGDIIDDFCVRCKRIMNHAVVSVLNNEPAKVRCRTCHSDHDYRHEQAPPPKIDPRKQALFNEVLKKVDPSATPAAAAEGENGAEASKAEAPNAEAPNAEAPNAEAPNAEAPNAETPNAETPNAEAPKPEAPKPQAPKAHAKGKGRK